ncbi:hypothetical protein C8J57DRAFT_1725873, partial [Mycena rebaudengoi]
MRLTAAVDGVYILPLMLSAVLAHTVLFHRQTVADCPRTCVVDTNPFGCSDIDVPCRCKNHNYLDSVASCINGCTQQDAATLRQNIIDACAQHGVSVQFTQTGITTSTTTITHSESQPIGAIAGGTVGGVAFLAILGWLWWYLRRRHRHTIVPPAVPDKPDVQKVPTSRVVGPNEPNRFPTAQVQHEDLTPVTLPAPLLLPRRSPPPVPTASTSSYNNDVKAPIVMRWEPPSSVTSSTSNFIGSSPARERELENEVHALREQVTSLSPPSYE